MCSRSRVSIPVSCAAVRRAVSCLILARFCLCSARVHALSLDLASVDKSIAEFMSFPVLASHRAAALGCAVGASGLVAYALAPIGCGYTVGCGCWYIAGCAAARFVRRRRRGLRFDFERFLSFARLVRRLRRRRPAVASSLLLCTSYTSYIMRWCPVFILPRPIILQPYIIKTHARAWC